MGNSQEFYADSNELFNFFLASLGWELNGVVKKLRTRDFSQLTICLGLPNNVKKLIFMGNGQENHPENHPDSNKLFSFFLASLGLELCGKISKNKLKGVK